MSMSVNVRPDENGKDPAFQMTAAWTATTDSAVNAAVTTTKAAATGKTHYITAIEVTITGAAAVNDISIELKDGATTIWKEFIGSGAPRGNTAGVVLTYPFALTAGNAANLVVAAGGAGVVATANLSGYTV